MKKLQLLLYLFLWLVMGSIWGLYAQAPALINYQAVARNASGQVLPNQNIALRISIRQSTAAGAVQYQERHTGATNSQGLINLQIGDGTALSGSFEGITWADGLPKFLQIELDPAGGTSYLNMGAQQLVSVPYALVAGSVAGSWQTQGNEGTNAAVNFIGTTDNQPLQIKINNLPAGHISETNTSLGVNAAPYTTTGTFNEAVGINALINNTTGNNNVAIGTNSLYNNNGNHNTAIGRSALNSNTSGFSNVALGAHALYSSVYPSNLVAIGDSALFNNNAGGTTGTFDGQHNTAVGSKTLFSNTIGSSNTALGYNAMYSNTTGYRNTAIGKNALYASTIGIDNTAIGFEALRLNMSSFNTALGCYTLYNTTTGNCNTGMGYYAGHNNTTGYYNTANGCLSLYSNTDGIANTALGASALYNNAIGSSNVAIGASALFSSVNRNNNVAIGDSALFANGLGVAPNSLFQGAQNTAAGSKALLNNTTGWQNTAIGYHALYNNVTGTGNTALGVAALSANTNGAGNVAIGMGALSANTSGQLNVAVGDDALYGNTTGWYNTGVGVSSGGNVAALTNSVAVGYGSFPNNSNVALLGNTTTLACGGYSNWNNFSDGRFKTNVQENVAGLAFIKALRPVTYTIDLHKLNQFIYKEKAADYEQAMVTGIAEKENIVQTGFIAQEVVAAAQQLGYDFDGVFVPKDPTQNHYTISYATFVPPLVKAVQEQQTIIETQNATIKQLQIELEAIKTMLLDASRH